VQCGYSDGRQLEFSGWKERSQRARVSTGCEEVDVASDAGTEGAVPHVGKRCALRQAHEQLDHSVQNLHILQPEMPSI
jgi:hypothetical protein